MIKLETPNISHHKMYDVAIEELEREWIEALNPASTFSYRDWNYSELLEREALVQLWKIEWLVPAHTFFCIHPEEQQIVWAIQIRHHINHPNLIHRWGHIGYGILPSHRRKWYATKMLYLALWEAKKIGLDKVLITCDTDNIASKKVIERNNGILESKESDKKWKEFYRYWITL